MKIKKPQIIWLSWSILAFGAGANIALVDSSLAQDRFDYGSTRHFERGRRDSERDSLMLGICAGQALAQQGISVPVPQPSSTGEPDTLDATTESAIQSAIESCRSQIEGGGTEPSPTPSSTVTPAPSGTESSNPVPTPTATDPSGGSSASGSNS